MTKWHGSCHSGFGHGGWLLINLTDLALMVRHNFPRWGRGNFDICGTRVPAQSCSKQGILFPVEAMIDRARPRIPGLDVTRFLRWVAHQKWRSPHVGREGIRTFVTSVAIFRFSEILFNSISRSVLRAHALLSARPHHPNNRRLRLGRWRSPFSMISLYAESWSYLLFTGAPMVLC